MLFVKAVQYLSEIGTLEAAIALMELLKHRDETIRKNALLFGIDLFLLSSVRARTIDTLTDVLQADDSSSCRSAAAYILGKIGCERSVATLNKALNDSDIEVRKVVTKALSKIYNLENKKISIQLNRSLESDEEQQTENENVIGDERTNLESVKFSETYDIDKLIAQVNHSHSSWEEREKNPSSQAISMREPWYESDDDLSEEFDDGDGDLSEEFDVNSSSVFNTNENDELANNFTSDLDDEQYSYFDDELIDRQREKAAKFLKQLGDRAAGKLIAKLSDGDKEDCRQVVVALGETCSQAAVKHLVDIFYQDVYLRWYAAAALFNIGGASVVEALLPALNSEDLDTRGVAAYTLAEIGGDDITEILIQTFFPDYEPEKIEYFSNWGRAGEAAVRAISPLLDSDSSDLREKAAYALGDIGSESGTEFLIKALRDPDRDVQYRAVFSLANIGSDLALQALIDFLNYLENLENENSEGDKNYWIRRCVAKILSNFDCPAALDYFAWEYDLSTMPDQYWDILWNLQNRLGIYSNLFYESNSIPFTSEDLESNSSDSIFKLFNKLEEVLCSIQVMTDQPKYNFPNAQKVQIFEQVETYIENNNSNAIDPNTKQSLNDLQQIVSDLQRRHPQATEEEATAIIEVEFEEIKLTQPQRWRNLLSLKRLWNGVKKGSIKIGEHFAEETPWGKGVIGFLEGITDDE
jgi:HEAT repeat protein